MQINRNWLDSKIRLWLDEDVGTGDITTDATVDADARGVGIVHVKEPGVIAGLEVAEQVFQQIDPDLQLEMHTKDGDFVGKGMILFTISGSLQSILTGERLALNLLQRLSGIATKTREITERLEGLQTRVVDTRKTTPGLRLLEKYAVRAGGGANHRFGLYDAVLIKDNHIRAAGGVVEAIVRARKTVPHSMKIEVEVETLTQLDQALEAGPDIIMLDNMDLTEMKRAVDTVKTRFPHIIVEASGNITLENIRQVAETGVDVISSGSMTHSVKALDISLDLSQKKG